VLARLGGMRLGLIRLPAQPGDDRNAVVAEDHEAVVQVPDEPGELQLENAIEGADHLLRLEAGQWLAHGSAPGG
jgi:hypothetical protein